MSEVPYLTKLLQNLKKSSIDDFIDRVFLYTTLLLVVCAIVAGAKTLKNPITCMLPGEFPDEWKSYYHGYCYISSTYYVKNGDGTSDNKVYQGYYQWVPFILVIQALLLYLPNIAWKAFLRSQIINFQYVVEKAKALSLMTGEEYQDGLTDIVEYLKERLIYQETENGIVTFGVYTVLAHILAKLIAIIMIIFELSFMNNNFGPSQDSFWGFTMLKQSMSNDLWNATGIFPRQTFCEFHQPFLGGDEEDHERKVQCFLPQNMVNEKMFIVIWFWLALLLLVAICDIFYTVFIRLSASYRYESVKDIIQYNLSDDDTISDFDYDFDFDFDDSRKDDLINFAFDMLGPDGVYLFDCITYNAGSLVAGDIAARVVEEVYEEY